ncbi:MAG: extracellular solute-binding protein [Opitutaceae bacterium]|nr:extracellular solute-binding protein [Opitutaceae bacterium]
MTPSREWIGRGLVLATLVAVVALPFALRKESAPSLRADDTVVIITPHNEAIRSEFSRGFERWYRERTGRSVALDWRVIGGTSEITRFLESEYMGSFQLHWTRTLGRKWSDVVQRSFDNPKVALDDTPADDDEAQAARRAFLASEVGCGIDVFFGGGTFDFIKQADAGRLVDSGIVERQPAWFTDAVIPEIHGGERFWARDRLWVGAVLSSFGILYNRDSIQRLGLPHEPRDWRDLNDPRYLGEVALADPTKSSSIGKAFEMVIQREMQVRLREVLEARSGLDAETAEKVAVPEGWVRGLQVLQLAGANARYFTDTSQKPAIDVGQGDAAAGMCIDFYGRSQAGVVSQRERAGGTTRLGFITPPGGSVFSVDPIALMRGAANRSVAQDFIEYVLSAEAQNLWNFRAGEPGGPEIFSLRRLPVRRDSYAPELEKHRSDPETNPYGEDNTFVYRGAWTGRLFTEMSFIVRVVCLDAHDELVDAWRAIIEAGMPADALAVLQDMSVVDYAQAGGRIKGVLAAKDPIAELRLGRELANHFREQYLRAEAMARAKR